MTSYLTDIKTVRDVLSVAPVLTFASSSKTTAKEIIAKLLDIFRSQIPFQEYYQEKLPFDDVQSIQRYIELCLQCNFQANARAELTSTVAELFPNGEVLFYGVSSATAISLAYFISHCDPEAIRSITLRPIAHASEPGAWLGPEYKNVQRYVTTTEIISRRKDTTNMQYIYCLKSRYSPRMDAFSYTCSVSSLHLMYSGM